jgi:Tol biopolymer transport system component
VQLDGTRRVTALVQSPFTERNAAISPDGRWLAYEADDSGEPEIYVRPYPDVNSGHWQVSTGGGTRPLWGPNGQELFYLSRVGALMRVGVARSQLWAAATPATLLNMEGWYLPGGTNNGRSYDVSPDGQRFLFVKRGETDQAAVPTTLIVVQNWTEELKRLVPVN